MNANVETPASPETRAHAEIQNNVEIPNNAEISDRLRVARVLVLVELVLAVTSVFESAVVAALGFGLPGAAILTALHVVLLALAARVIGRRGRRRLAIGLQIASLVIAGVDLVISAFVGMAPLPVPILVRIVLPIAVLVLLRRPRAAVPA